TFSQGHILALERYADVRPRWIRELSGVPTLIHPVPLLDNAFLLTRLIASGNTMSLSVLVCPTATTVLHAISRRCPPPSSTSCCRWARANDTATLSSAKLPPAPKAS